MSFNIVTVKFSSDKTCSVALSSGILPEAKDEDKPQIFSLEGGRDKIYVSWSGEVLRHSGDNDGVLQISGLFGEKLGLREGDQVMLYHVPKSSVKYCTSCYLEPLSYDDWEILDRHSSFIESNLLHIVRVVQKNKVYPVWVEKSVCIFIKVGAVVPDEECVLLQNNTEVIITPKVRSSAIGQPRRDEPMKKFSSDPLPDLSSPNEFEDDSEPMFKSTDSESSSIKDWLGLSQSHESRKSREKSPYDNISSHWNSLKTLLGFRSRAESHVLASDDEDDDYYDEEDAMDNGGPQLQSGLNLVLRVQSLNYKVTESDKTSPEFTPVLRHGNESPRKSGSSSPRKGSRENSQKGNRAPSLPKVNFKLNYFPQQPSTIYMDMTDIEKQLKCNRSEIPLLFYARLRKLSSPGDQGHEKTNKNSGDNKQSNGVKSSSETNPKTTAASDMSEPSSGSAVRSNDDIFCIVRVVVVDRRRHMCDDHYCQIVKRILQDQPLIRGHVIIPDMLRRFLKLEVTGRVWIQTFKNAPAPTLGFSLYPLGNIPEKVTNDMVSSAFKQWLSEVAIEEYPMVVFQGLFLNFQIFKGKYIECQLTYKVDGSYSKSFAMLHLGILRNLTVVNKTHSSDVTNPVIQPMLAYTSLASFDPPLLNRDLKTVGGMDDLVTEAISNIEICLGSRRLYKDIFLTTPGLLNGMLLLTGPKGSGKTTVGLALCKKMMELPNLAYTTIIDCKPLRGKKVETIQKLLEFLFDKAAWHQPSLIVLDDLDHICAAPGGPEFEMTAEALLAARIAEVVKDLLRKDIRNMSNIAVMATSQSRSTLHPILVSSRGTHLVQEVMSIKPPNKGQRKEILKTILTSRSLVKEEKLDDLDLDQLAHRTEGYVARDLENVVNRAIHAYIFKQGRSVQDVEVDLTREDFEVAMNGFTPASIRNVPLHQAGDLGWKDIGGLTDVKETLIETLQWPTKYPALFANCPLRLRSGLLLYGAPGTGKTLLAGVVAKECGLNFISIKGPELLSKYIGASEQAVRDTFLRAQSAKPCILFFDEFDSIAPRRGHDNTGVTDRVVNQLLTQLDGVEGLDGVYVLAATSRPDLIDPALLRPGRLDKCLHCKLPNKEERFHILKALSLKMSLSDNVNLQHFADTCKDFTGADFKALLYNAQLEAIHEFTASHEESIEFGKKRKRGPASRLKTRPGLNLKVDVSRRERHRSGSPGTLAYIPSLEEGIVQVSAEMEERLSSQVTVIRMRERRVSEPFLEEDKPESPFQKNILLVTQQHLETAANKMRPSVSGAERSKYQRIYDRFVSSRGGHFDTGYMEDKEFQMKATLA